MKLAGIDSCPLGWVVILHHDGQFSFEVVSNIPELTHLHPDLERIFIDIPIGLSSSTFTRTIEFKMRKELGKRSSTIFTPASREAIYASNYDEARAINKNILGKSISIQSYNISKKIKEVDEYIQKKPQNIEIYESHPEICFKYLNNSKVIPTKKSTQEGFQERLNLLLEHQPKLEAIYESIAEIFPKSKVKPDDILDAMVLCVSNLNSKENLRFIEDENNLDDLAIKVKIAY
jgi:predicted RNase H-like nuclease